MPVTQPAMTKSLQRSSIKGTDAMMASRMDSDSEPRPDRQDHIGLCSRCTHVQIIRSNRGSTYYLCRVSLEDARFPKYPRLPVLRCSAFDVSERSLSP